MLALFARRIEPDLPRMPFVDAAEGRPEARLLLNSLGGDRWEAAERLMGGAEDDLLDLFCEGISGLPGRPAWVEAWTRARPDSWPAWLARGSQSTGWAWQAHPSGAQDPAAAEAGWSTFLRRLETAERELGRAAELSPGLAIATARLIPVAAGRAMGRPALAAIFGEVRRLRPHFVGAGVAMVHAAGSKWGGDNAHMFDLARRFAAQAPPGHPARVVIPAAHIEAWLWARDHPEAGITASRYFLQTEVQEEIREAAARCLWSADLESHPREIQCRNLFAFCLWMMGELKAASTQFERIGCSVTAYPWRYLGDPARMFIGARSLCARVRAPEPAA